MSDETISIGELEAKREGWPATLTPVISESGSWYGQFDHSDNEHAEEGYIECNSLDMDEATRFAALIAAEHNATPVLIAIAKAALLHEQARVAFETSAQNDDRPVFEGKRAAMQQAHRELLSALKAVRL